MRKDALTLVEEAYTLEGTTDEWLSRLAANASVIDDGMGVIAYRLRGDITNIDAFASTNPLTYGKEILLATTKALPERDHKAFFPTRAISSLCERLGGPLHEHPLYDTWFKPAGMEDALGLVAADGTDALIVLSAPLRQRKVWRPRERARLDRIMVHVGAANRLRGRLRREGLGTLDAVLAPDGKVLHASGEAASPEAREQLRSRARGIDRARTKVRHSDELAALELWQGLIAGKWSLCDHFDSDGRRFLIVRENDPDFVEHPALTRRETQLLELYARGQSQKLIAYELGLSYASVSHGLRKVASKLGAVNLAELAAIATKLGELRSHLTVPSGPTSDPAE